MSFVLHDRLPESVYEVEQRPLQKGYDHRQEYGESMCSLEAVPDQIVFCGGGPAASHEEVEEEVHHKQQNDDVHDLGGRRATMVREREFLRLTK